MKYIKQISTILGICFLSEVLEYLIPLPIAASIYGLVLMLAALVTKIIPLKEVEGVADFLTENMTIMFIPATVGIMASVDAIREMLLPLVVISVATTLLIMSVTGWVAQGIMSRKKDGQETMQGGSEEKSSVQNTGGSQG